MTSVTFDVDDDLLARARQLAAANKIPLSEMLRRLLRVAVQPALRAEELGPATRQAQGILPAMTDEQVKAALDEQRIRKYGS